MEPSGLQHGLEEVLILTEGVHQPIPEAPSGMQPVYMRRPFPVARPEPAEAAVPATSGTEADRLRTQYKALGEEQNHTYGDNPPGTKPVDFTKLGSPSGALVRRPARIPQRRQGRGMNPPAATPNPARRAPRPRNPRRPDRRRTGTPSAVRGPSATPGSVTPKVARHRHSGGNSPSKNPAGRTAAGAQQGRRRADGTPKVAPSDGAAGLAVEVRAQGPLSEPSRSAVPPPATPKNCAAHHAARIIPEDCAGTIARGAKNSPSPPALRPRARRCRTTLESVRRHSAGGAAALMTYSGERILLSSQREGQISRFHTSVFLVGTPRGHPVPGLRPHIFSVPGFPGNAAPGGGVFRDHAAQPDQRPHGRSAGGLAQDSLSKNPLGMFGIVKTLVGYFAASVGVRLDVEHG